ncbi:MAG: DciA family protein [Candidatus Gracilibacteria bacterium]|jgi:hypothetical protein
MSFEPLKNVLNRVLADKKMQSTFSAAEACSSAEKLFLAELPEISGKFAVKSIKEGVVQIAVVNSAIAAQMRMCETTVLEILQNRFPKAKKIRYSVGPLPEMILPY